MIFSNFIFIVIYLSLIHILAQNDLYICVSNSLENPENDNVKERFEAGEVTRSDLQRNAKNILKFIMKSQAMLHELNLISKEDLEEINGQDDDGNISLEDIVYYYADKDSNDIIIDASSFNNKKGNSEVFGITLNAVSYTHLMI